MNFVKVLVASAGLAALGSVQATALEVRQVAEVKAAPASVWAKVGGWCAIKDWHPAIAACDASREGYRTLTLKDGGKIVEKLTKVGKNKYSYSIVEGPLPVKNYTATLIAKADSLGTTDLTWVAKFDAAKGKTDAEATAAINGVFEGGLKNIKDNMKFDTVAAATQAPTVAAAAAAAAAPVSDAVKAAKETRRKKIAAAKLYFLEKKAKAKAEVAKFRAELAEKAKVAAEAAKAAYEKAKAIVEQAETAAKAAAKPHRDRAD